VNKQEFINYIKDPASLTKEDIPVLDELIQKFPFTSFPYLLKAKIFRDIDSIHFEKQLHLAAAYASDRKKLHELIHHHNPLTSMHSQPVPIEVESSINNEQLIEEELLITELSESENSAEADLPVNHFDTEHTTIEESFITIEEEINVDEPIINTENIPEIPEVINDSAPVFNHPDSLSFSDWLKHISHKNTGDPSSVIELDTTEEIRPLIQDELEKLFIENVFHEGYLLEVDHNEHPVVEFKLEGKQDKIIEEFIKKEPVRRKPEEPIIHPENKAKKSSDEHDIPVSETLATIFITQKLFTKAIAAYEKLSLKFPEKKTYFADLIQKIKEENQIN
jgi:hypothetical protein